LAFGVVSEKEREQFRGRALRETVLPCAGALLRSNDLARSVANGITSPLARDAELARVMPGSRRSARPIASVV
jgi:hypothetical protein